MVVVEASNKVFNMDAVIGGVFEVLFNVVHDECLAQIAADQS